MAYNPLKAAKKAVNFDDIAKAATLGGSAAAGLPILDKVLTGGTGKKALAKADPLQPTQEAKRKADAEAEEAARRAAGRYDDIGLPGESTQYSLPETLQFEQLIQEGYDPTEAAAAVTGDSKFGDISVDPKFAESQMAALQGLQGSVDSGGMSDADIANLAKVQSDVGRADRGRREAIQDRMRRQGMAGSGMDLLQQLSSGQAATDRASQAGLDIAGAASNRLRQDTRDLGTMATGLRDQDFGEQAQAASAQDLINRFNTANQQSVNLANQQAANQAAQFGAQATNKQNLFNTQGTNQTNQFNLQNKQGVQQSNVDMQNRDQQQAFENQMGLQSARSNADLGLATNRQATADRAARKEGQMIGGAGNIFATTAAAMASDEELKTDVAPISEIEIEEFLNAVKPKKYKYKDQKMGQGDRVGFMAQDLENSKVGQTIVQDTPEGKVVDNNNLLGAIVDSLGHLNKKVDKETEPVMIFGGN